MQRLSGGPAELEDVLRRHANVADVAVAGIPHPALGEEPTAFVVPAGEITDTELLDWTATRVARYARVRRVVFVPEIPRSPTGKILRRVLRESLR